MTGGIVHVRLVDLDVVKRDDRVELDAACLGALAHHLLVHLGIGRDVDHQVTANHRLTRQAPVGRELAVARAQASLDLGFTAHVVGAQFDAVFGV